MQYFATNLRFAFLVQEAGHLRAGTLLLRAAVGAAQALVPSAGNNLV